MNDERFIISRDERKKKFVLQFAHKKTFVIGLLNEFLIGIKSKVEKKKKEKTETFSGMDFKRQTGGAIQVLVDMRMCEM